MSRPAVVSARFVVLLLTVVNLSSAFTVPTRNNPGRSLASSSRLHMVPPLFKGKDYDKVVTGLMRTKGLTREEAEADYNAYLENPNNYALNKGEAYYKSLGYKSFMEGVIGEAEKEGRGDEVRERVAEFKKKSQLKATAVLVVFFSAIIYYKMNYVPEIVPGGL